MQRRALVASSWSRQMLNVAKNGENARKWRKWSGRVLPGRVNDGDDVAHDLRQIEVLWRVHARDAGLPQQLGVGGRNDAADHDGHVADAGPGEAVEHVAHQGDVAARQDRQADDMHALLECGVDDALGRQPDALVDYFHAAVAGPDGDLLGAVGMAVEAGLADQDLDAPTEPPRHRLDLATSRFEATVGDADRPRHPGRRAVLAEHRAQGLGPFAGRDARLGAGDRGRHDVAVFLGGHGEFCEGRLHRAGVAFGAPGVEALDLLALDRSVDGQDRAFAGAERRWLALGEGVDADDRLLARFDAGEALEVRFDQPLLHVGRVDRRNRAAHVGDALHLGQRLGLERLHLAGDLPAAVEDVAVFQQVGLERHDLLQPQRPLLVPRPRQAERLVPGRQLD